MKMRIVLFSGAYNHIADGVSLTLNRLVGFLEEQGAQVRVYAPTVRHPPVAHRGTLIPVPSVAAPGRSDYRISLGFSRGARRSLEAFRPNLFHIATPDYLGLRALHIARQNRIPVVASYHTHFASYLDYYHMGALTGITWKYLRWFYSQCRHVYVPTPPMADVLRSHGLSDNLRIWPRGVDSRHFSPMRRSFRWRRSLGIADDEPVVIFVSRLVPEKGLGVLAETLAGLAASGFKHRSVIVGDGRARANLASRLPGSIFTGQLSGDDLATAYASSDVFLFPSETETFGNVTLEAMASGLPTVCADAPGSNTLVRHGVTGFLAPPRDLDAFLRDVIRLITDADLRHRMSLAARSEAEAYDWNQVLSRIARYYEEVA